MRNAVVDGELVVTVDNAVAIGEKPLDAVHAPYDVVAAFTTRVLLLEQMCANATMTLCTVGNGAGEAAFVRYMAGIEDVFTDIGEPLPKMVVSTETNMPTQQSALTMTAIGYARAAREKGAYRYVIGHPHVGESVLTHQHEVAPLALIYKLWQQGIITHVWPTGSKGLAYECTRFFGDVPRLRVDMDVTCGPSTVVLVYAREPLTLAHVPYYEV